MNDRQILEHIQQLVDEEHQLRQRMENAELPQSDHGRLRELEVNLDQCWDLLRQRRARREFGQDPNEAHERDETTVERFEQ